MTKITDNTLTLKGYSGISYTFNLFTTDTDFKESWGGIYIFTKRTQKNNGGFDHDIIYIGKTKKFNQRLDGHEKWNDIKKAGGNCLCILKVDKEDDMLKYEEDLIKGQSPKLNVHHN